MVLGVRITDFRLRILGSLLRATSGFLRFNTLCLFLQFRFFRSSRGLSFRLRRYWILDFWLWRRLCRRLSILSFTDLTLFTIVVFFAFLAFVTLLGLVLRGHDNLYAADVAAGQYISKTPTIAATLIATVRARAREYGQRLTIHRPT